MAEQCEHPIIFPLSNPTRLHEAKPDDLIHWTDGKALIATGSPFDPVHYKDTSYDIGECNNSFAFPGIGLGCIVSRARHCTEEMIFAAANAISECSAAVKVQDPTQSLLPDVEQAREISTRVATAVVRKAVETGEARISFKVEEAEQAVRDFMWYPEYPQYELTTPAS